MKNKKEKIIGLAVLSLFLVAGISTAFAKNGIDWEAKKGLMEEKKTQMVEVFENGTYEDWIDMTNSNFEENLSRMKERHQERTSQITAENWERFKEAHQLMVNGDKEGARAIFEELGIERGMGAGTGKRGYFNKTRFSKI